jgi:hypothetical protein
MQASIWRQGEFARHMGMDWCNTIPPLTIKYTRDSQIYQPHNQNLRLWTKLGNKWVQNPCNIKHPLPTWGIVWCDTITNSVFHNPTHCFTGAACDFTLVTPNLCVIEVALVGWKICPNLVTLLSSDDDVMVGDFFAEWFMLGLSKWFLGDA